MGAGNFPSPVRGHATVTRFDDWEGRLDAPDPADVALALLDGHRPTDVGNANRLVAAADGHLRYVHLWGKWLVYDDGRWIIDFREAMIGQRARAVARKVFQDAAHLDEKIREIHFRWARSSESSSSIGSMINLARGTPGILIDHTDLDQMPWVLNVLNGTVDLRTGDLRPHNPEDLLTVQAPVVYDPTAEAPLWDACLERWQPDPEIRSFLQRACGTAVSGHPLEHLFVNHGAGSNGKTKFFEAIEHVLGGYAVTPSKGIFVMTKHEDHKTELASLFGARMLVLPETGQADRLNEASVKNLTGGDSHHLPADAGGRVDVLADAHGVHAHQPPPEDLRHRPRHLAPHQVDPVDRDDQRRREGRGARRQAPPRGVGDPQLVGRRLPQLAGLRPRRARDGARRHRRLPGRRRPRRPVHRRLPRREAPRVDPIQAVAGAVRRMVRRRRRGGVGHATPRPGPHRSGIRLRQGRRRRLPARAGGAVNDGALTKMTKLRLFPYAEGELWRSTGRSSSSSEPLVTALRADEAPELDDPIWIVDAIAEWLADTLEDPS